MQFDGEAGPTKTLRGKVTHIHSGDMIEVEGIPVRLNGLAAPEGEVPGGDRDTAAMHAIVDRTARPALRAVRRDERTRTATTAGFFNEIRFMRSCPASRANCRLWLVREKGPTGRGLVRRSGKGSADPICGVLDLTLHDG